MMLRAVMIWLVCLNLGAGLWWWLHATDAPMPAPEPLPGVARLVLLSELPAATITPSKPSSANVRCLSIGPFTTQDALRSAMRRLTPQAERIQLRELPGTELLGYRVYLPPAPSRRDAVTLAAQLRSRGVRDYYLVTAGPQKNAIALGLYRDLASAEQRRAELKRLGVTAVLEARSQALTNAWIDLVIAADIDWRALLDANPNLQEQPMACQGVTAPDPPDASPDPPDTATTR